MKNSNFKILLPVVGILLLVVSVLALQGVLAGIGLGIAGLLVFGPDVVEKKGKTAGLVYSKNRSGHYTKARVKPRNPQSNSQQANRALHKQLMQQWKSTEVDQKAYNEYASSHPVPNRIGHKICLSGINWFVRFNRMAKKVNPEAALILTPPVKDTVFPLLTGVTVTASAATNSVIVEPIKRGDYVEGMVLEVIATRQLSYGVSCPFGFRSIGVYDPNSDERRAMSDEKIVSGIDVTTDYVAKFGAVDGRDEDICEG